MGLGFTQKNEHKIVPPRTVELLFEVSMTGRSLSTMVSCGTFLSYVILAQIGCSCLSVIGGDTGSMRGRKIDNGFTIVNISRKWYEFDLFILATQAAQVFNLNDLKLGDNYKVVQKLTNRNIYNVPAIVERDDDQGMNVDVYQERVYDGSNIVEDSTILCRDDATISIDELYVQLDSNLFVDNNPPIEEYNTNSDGEEELSSNNDTDSEHADDFDHKDSSSSDSDAEYDDDMC
jgi:hypothetical protein